MESRRGSLISNTSVRDRKYSTDRVLRQAELSARLEEGRPMITPPYPIDEDPNEDAAERLQYPAISSLTRADSLVSPFAVHPGQRVYSFPLAAAAGINTDYEWNATKPWNEPTASQEEDIERRAAVTKRVETTSLDLTPAQAHIYGGLTQPADRSSTWNWPLRKSKRPRIKDPSLSSGLHMATAMHTALGLGFIAQRRSDQQLHIIEYKTGKSKAFSCGSNLVFREQEKFKQHLANINGTSPQLMDGSTVRLIHVRGDENIFKYVDEAFGISSAEIHHGERGFRQWMQDDRDPRRTFNMTIRWRPGFDTNRQVSCMALGIDLGSPEISTKTSKSNKKVLRQDSGLFQKCRIAVYMQRTPAAATPNPRVIQFSSKGHTFAEFAKQDNILLCEYSSNALNEISNTSSLLALSPVAGFRKTGSAAVMASVISHVFWEIVSKWHARIAAIHQPFADLEERVHAQPADITHADEVWDWSRYLQNMLRLVVRHLKAIQMFQDDFQLFAEIDEVEWLDDTLGEMKHIADTIRGDYIEPLEHMIDLMYKSVTIRDSRLSLELGTSLWRLSWITFIFLPLTFLVGFFGMNVSIFHDDPSIKWYFVALVPLVIVVVAFWFAFHEYGSAYKTHALRNKADAG